MMINVNQRQCKASSVALVHYFVRISKRLSLWQGNLGQKAQVPVLLAFWEVAMLLESRVFKAKQVELRSSPEAWLARPVNV